jgi:hypothetical protein
MGELCIAAREQELGRLAPETSGRAAQILREDGVLLLRDVLPPELRRGLRERIGGVEAFIARRSPPGPEEPFAELPVERDSRRFDVQLRPGGGLMSRGLIDHWALLPVLRSYLGAGLRLASTGVICALPGATFGGVHRDGTVPAGSMVNVYWAIEPVIEAQGPTEYWIGSHRLFERVWTRLELSPPGFSWGQVAAGAGATLARYLRGGESWRHLAADLVGTSSRRGLRRKWRRLRLCLENRVLLAGLSFPRWLGTLDEGSALVVDYDVFHRGTVNRTSRPRRLLYMTFAASSSPGLDPNFETRARLSPQDLAALSPKARALFA